MAPNVPTVTQRDWVSLIPHILLIGLLTYVYYLLNIEDPSLFGILTYLVLAFGLRNLVAKSHRKGVRLLKQQKFNEAIPYFEKSADYFSKNSWVDKYRFLTLLSSSKMTYRAMDLCNIAFCYSQTGNGLKAKELYQQILREYPENGVATAALNMLNSLEVKTENDK